ncbi:L-aspartate oxidase [Brevibacterium spongiae]|uniref:L-aspartate oxidase n=1 Tax=Brevibacterium spongiae TaxID=2909672 RepID=A0ABY5SLZ6_9MICO|nr:L-aspartate oxidase [Brevibacterium spongiae]UVI35174.1 L-aspartate oxidase [Brevibacterium spongiae]
MSRVIIVGTGIAGLTAAVNLAGRHRVTLITKGRLGESNTAWAQGGIAGVIGVEDTIDSHIADTLSAGVGHCDVDAVRVLCEAGGDALATLAEAGVDFDTDPTGDWARGMEGAHSHPRIFHSGGDATGRAITAALAARLRSEVAAGRVELYEHTMLVDIITADNEPTGHGRTMLASSETPSRATGVTVLRGSRLERLAADAIVLATGGAGQLFAHTTNPLAATGDGLAAAIRAGAVVRDLEFFQFHPTALAGAGFLISEAVRGAGALLLDEQGRRFMREVDERAELAPRDVVALALHRRQAAQDGRPCFLDARAIPNVAAKFPSITAGLAEHGLDLSRDLIPISPAAHYFMGGVATDVGGRTSIDRLFAVGEAACTGVHGANRLASNSLLEGAVFAGRAATAIEAQLRRDSVIIDPDHHLPFPRFGPLPQYGSFHQTALTRTELQRLAWDHLGVERTATGLRILLDRLGEGTPDTSDGERGTTVAADRGTTISAEQLETANLALIARHMADHALAREHSLGAHTRTDAPFISSTALLQEATAC